MFTPHGTPISIPGYICLVCHESNGAIQEARVCSRSLSPAGITRNTRHTIFARLGVARAHRRFVAYTESTFIPLSLTSTSSRYIWPPSRYICIYIYTLIARIRWSASNPILLFEHEIWVPRKRALESFEDFPWELRENVVSLHNTGSLCILCSHDVYCLRIYRSNPPFSFRDFYTAVCSEPVDNRSSIHNYRRGSFYKYIILIFLRVILSLDIFKINFIKRPIFSYINISFGMIFLWQGWYYNQY